MASASVYQSGGVVLFVEEITRHSSDGSAESEDVML